MIARLLVALILASAAAACEREQREFRSDPAKVEEPGTIATSQLAPGGEPPPQAKDMGKHYEQNAHHLSEGKRLYVWFNCNGCHGNGGGGSGPALMDDKWIYGGELPNIAATIRDGRPNGMPSFGSKVPMEQIWQIAAYVRSMGRHVPKDAAPGRNDTLHPRPAENRLPPAPPGSTTPSGPAAQ